MKHFFALIFSLASFAGLAHEPQKEVHPQNLFPQVKFETSIGDFVVELNRTRAPVTVNNFLTYVVANMYDGTVFHRVEPGYIAQGGGYDAEFVPKAEGPSIFNEAGNGLKNDLYTIAMARQNDPHSATRQFFFNLNDNDSLNPIPRWGYAVFGEVIEGQDVIEKFNDVETEVSEKSGWPSSPVTDIVIKKVRLLPAQ